MEGMDNLSISKDKELVPEIKLILAFVGEGMGHKITLESK